MKQRAIQYQKPQRLERPYLIGAFDVETKGLDGKLVLAQSYHELWSEAHIYHKVEHFLEYIFNDIDKTILALTIWYIHNINYDMRYIYDVLKPWLEHYDLECCERSPSKFYEIRVVSKTEFRPNGDPVVITRFRDSMAVFPHSLAKFTESFAPNFVKIDIGLGRGVEFNRNNPLHIEYAKNDVIGLVEAIKKYDAATFESFGVHLKGTTSGTAYAAWLRTLPKDLYIRRQSPMVEEFFRKCYNGGLVQINANHGEHYEETTTFDINSSYPASMKLGVPKGKGVWTRTYRDDFPGFYHATVTIPDDAIMPIIPARAEHNLAWARGTFETYVSSIEIEHALSYGALFKIHSGFYFPQGLVDCFVTFVTICERLREQFKRTDKAKDITVKLMQNSLYGRFGMRPEGRECKVSRDGVPKGYLPVIDEDTGKAFGEVYWKPVTREAEYMLPHFAAWITANSRILIDRATEAAGRRNVLYRDTDSITIIGREASPALAALVGEAYGQLKCEGLKFDTRYHAPKSYTYRDREGALHAVYKGIPASLLDPEREGSAALLAALHRGDPVEVIYHSSTSLPTYWRIDKKAIVRTRRATNVENVYGHVLEFGRFRPKLIAA